MKAYIRLFRKWAWLIILAALVTSSLSYFLRSRAEPVYTASTTLIVGNTFFASNPEQSEFNVASDLAQTYAVLARRRDVVNAVRVSLNLDVTTEQLERQIRAQLIPDTLLLEIRASDSDPNLAAQIANEVARQVIEKSPTNLSVDELNQIEIANEQILLLSQQIVDNQERLNEIDTDLTTATDANTINRLTARHNALVDQINIASNTISRFSETIANLQERINRIEIFELADVPTRPGGVNIYLVTIVGAVVGVLLATAIILYFDYADDSIKTTHEVVKYLDLPLLGAIPRFNKLGAATPESIISQQSNDSIALEAFHNLQAQLTLNRENHSVYVFTTPTPDESHTLAVVNLSLTLANSNIPVILIDADMRQPTIHKLLSLDNEAGLGTLLAAAELDQETLDSYLIPVSETLTVLPAGAIPEKPISLLNSANFKENLYPLLTNTEALIILINTPPALRVPDCQLIAKTLHGEVILVVKENHTSRDAMMRAKENLHHFDIPIKGVIVANVHPSELK